MQTFSLNLAKRASGKAAKKERNEEQVFGVVYGHGIDSTAVVADHRELITIFKETGTNRIVDITIDGKEKYPALFKEIDNDPVSGRMRHFDLYVIKRGEKINAEVPIELVGESPATRFGNLVHQLLDKVEVAAIPSKLPEQFTVDISKLEEVGDSIHVADLPAGGDDYEVLTDKELPIVKIDEPRQIEEEEVPEEEEVGEAGEVPSEHGGEAEAETDESGGEAAAEDSTQNEQK